MPEIDLPPSKYRWRRPLSKPLAWSYVGVAVVLLGWIFLNRTFTNVEFFLTVGIAVALGVLLHALLGHID